MKEHADAASLPAPPAIDYDCNAKINAYDKAVEDLIEAARTAERTKHHLARAKDDHERAEAQLQGARMDLRQAESAKRTALKKRDG